MHLGGYSVGAAAVKQLGGIVPMELAKKAGFTVAGPYYGPFANSKAAMERAASLGLKVAAQLEVPPALHFSKEEAPNALKLRGPKMEALSEEDIRKWVREDMDNFLKNPVLNKAVSCWAVSPEELRFWVKGEMRYLQMYLKAVNDYDPEHRPVYMYEPNHRDTAALLKTGGGQGFVLEGAYVHSFGWDVRRALRINWAMDQMTGAAGKDHRVIVPGLQLSQDMPGFTSADLKNDPNAVIRLHRLLRHDVFLAIVRGAQGFQVWSLHPFRKEMTTYLELMEGYGKAFGDLKPLQESILFGRRCEDVELSIVRGPAIIPGAPANGGELDAVEGKIKVQNQTWPSVRMANIAYGKERTLILVNSAVEGVTVRLAGIPVGANVKVLSGGEAGKLARDASGVEVSLEPFAALVLGVSKDVSSAQ